MLSIYIFKIIDIISQLNEKGRRKKERRYEKG